MGDESSSLVRATPLVDDQRNIYLTNLGGTGVHDQGVIHKFTPIKELVWTHRHSAPLPAVPALLGNHLCQSEAFSNVAIGGDGTCYVGHTSGQLFALKDKNGDGKIDESQGEVSSYAGNRCYYGSPAIA